MHYISDKALQFVSRGHQVQVTLFARGYVQTQDVLHIKYFKGTVLIHMYTVYNIVSQEDHPS